MLNRLGNIFIFSYLSEKKMMGTQQAFHTAVEDLLSDKKLGQPWTSHSTKEGWTTVTDRCYRSLKKNYQSSLILL